MPHEPIIKSNCNPEQNNGLKQWGVILVTWKKCPKSPLYIQTVILTKRMNQCIGALYLLRKKMPHPRLAIIKSIYNADQNNESKLWGIIFVRWKIPLVAIIKSNCYPDQKNESKHWGIIFVKIKIPHV